ncbi:MAG: sugar ABC transporter permease [Actinobacteria bacterium]|nr:sugar ABC transporter permease [Actinomycetota bacterium]
MTEQKHKDGANSRIQTTNRRDTLVGVLRAAWLIGGPLLVVAALVGGFLFLRDNALTAPKLLVAAIAIVWGVGGVIALFALAATYVGHLRLSAQQRLSPFIFVGPAVLVLGLYLVYPTVETLYLSFLGPKSHQFVGLSNYIFAFTDESMTTSFRNNALWLIFGTGLSVGFGLLIAVLAERTAHWFELTVKSIIFMPMAISLVGASIIWLFVYAYRPPGSPQIGILNAVLTGLGGQPQAWLLGQPWNTLFLIAILIWGQTGFAMVIFSAALKGVPLELVEAGRIDGGNESRIFFAITLPYIRGTVVMVTTTIVIFTLKIFDIVLTMTGGNYGTQVIANAYYDQQFKFFQPGRASAIAIVLLLLVTPVMWYNLRNFRSQTEAFR